MRFLIDENLSHRLVRLLVESFPGSVHLSQTDLPMPSEDHAIWHYALENNFVILTQDKDFYNISQWNGSPPQVVLLHAWNLKTNEIAKRLNFEKEMILQKLSLSEVEVLEIFF